MPDEIGESHECESRIFDAFGTLGTGECSTERDVDVFRMDSGSKPEPAVGSSAVRFARPRIEICRGAEAAAVDDEALVDEEPFSSVWRSRFCWEDDVDGPLLWGVDGAPCGAVGVEVEPGVEVETAAGGGMPARRAYAAAPCRSLSSAGLYFDQPSSFAGHECESVAACCTPEGECVWACPLMDEWAVRDVECGC